MTAAERHPASFRDPSGHVFLRDGRAYRAVMAGYRPHYDHLMAGGLYARLTGEGLMLPHEEIPGEASHYRTLLPEQLHFQSMPQEWSFEMLKSAALTTLRLATLALESGMILKDATPYNLTFHRGRPVLLDSLSFELYEEGKPWQAFRQFCESFLYPLVLQHWHARISPALLLTWPDGIPAEVAAPMLPRRTRLNLNHQLYVHLPARVAAKALSAPKAGSGKSTTPVISKTRLRQNLAQLTGFVQSLKPRAARSVWNHYYEETLLSQAYLKAKEAAVVEALGMTSLSAESVVVDLGANTGVFSLMATQQGAGAVIATDFDHLAIDALYSQCRKEKLQSIHPLVADLTLPTPGIGWMNAERKPLLERLRGDVVMALALVHHLCISRNVRLDMFAELLALVSRDWAIAEFVPKSDPKVQELLKDREDIFDRYTQPEFEAAMAPFFTTVRTWPIASSDRILYLLRKHSASPARSDGFVVPA